MVVLCSAFRSEGAAPSASGDERRYPQDRSARHGEAAKDRGEHLVDLADAHQARHREEHRRHDDPADGQRDGLRQPPACGVGDQGRERFAFRWDYGRDEAPTPQNSLLVTFVITPHGGGSLLTVVEEGFRERGWEAAALQKYHERHDHGWAVHLASLGRYLQAVPTGGIR